MNKNDGGPAFPRYVNHEYGSLPQNGMSLRDWFAGQAMSGFISRPSFSASAESMAIYSYEYADAMLKAREK